MSRITSLLIAFVVAFALVGCGALDSGQAGPIVALVTSDQIAVFLPAQSAPPWDSGFPATISCTRNNQPPVLVSKILIDPAQTVLYGLPIDHGTLQQQLAAAFPPSGSTLSKNPCAFVWIEIDKQATFGEFHSTYVAAIRVAESAEFSPSRILVGTPDGGGPCYF